MTPWRTTSIQLRPLPSGVLRVGPFVAGAAGLGRLYVPGGVLLVDPLTPHAPPTVEVSDPSHADGLLRVLYGDAVADAAAAAATELASPDAPARMVEADPGPLLADVQALGQLVWLSQTSPWPLHPVVLTAELLVRTDAALDALDDRDAVAQAIGAYAEPVADLLGNISDLVRPAGIPDAVGALLADAAGAVARHVPLGSDAERGLLAAAAALRPVAPIPPAGGSPSDLLAALTPIPAVHAGTQEELFVGTATADWSRNARQSVSRDDDAATWTIDLRPGEGADVTVVVRTASAPAVSDPDLTGLSPRALLATLGPDLRWDAGGSACSLHTPAWPLPLAESLLTPSPQPGTLVGRLTVAAPLMEPLRRALTRGTLVVDLHDAGVRYAHLASVAGAVEAARRWTIRGLCATRLALAADDPLGRPDTQLAEAAVRSWSRAIALWRHASGRNEALAAVRVHQCAAWAALLTGAAAPEPLDLEGADAVAPAVDADVSVPAPSVVERLVLRGPNRP